MIIKNKETAILLGVSTQQIRKYVDEGKLTNVNSRRGKGHAHIRINTDEIEKRFNVKYDAMKILSAYPRVLVATAARLNGVASEFFRHHAEEFGFTNVTKIGGRYFVEPIKKDDVTDTAILHGTPKRKR